ncbi:MAG: outer membrane beta-barrel protein [Steroidobacteraceae bacterium]
MRSKARRVNTGTANCIAFRPLGGLILAACCVAAIPPSASAADLYTGNPWLRFLDAANPYATVQYGYDSNVLRLDSDVQSPESGSDQYTLLAAGFDTDVQLSQQRFELNARVSRQNFRRFDDLDYTGSKVAAIWHWSLGTASTGTLGYRHLRALRDFANQFNTTRVKDIRSEDHIIASGDVDVASHWRVGARTDLGSTTLKVSPGLDVQRVIAGTTVSYVSTAGNTVGLDLQLNRSDFYHNNAANFTETAFGPVMTWQLTASSQLVANLDYSSRNYQDAARPSYHDVTGRVTLKVADAGNAQVNATVWRDLSNLGDEVADYALIHGIGVEPRWQITPRLELRLNASYENRDFKVSPKDQGRKDKVWTAGAFGEWAIGRNIKLSLGVQGERRSSTRALQDYHVGAFQLQVTGSI